MSTTTHRLVQNRLIAHVELDEREQPAAVVIPLHTGDKVRIDKVADLGRLIRTLRACHDQMNHARQTGGRR